MVVVVMVVNLLENQTNETWRAADEQTRLRKMPQEQIDAMNRKTRQANRQTDTLPVTHSSNHQQRIEYIPRPATAMVDGVDEHSVPV